MLVTKPPNLNMLSSMPLNMLSSKRLTKTQRTLGLQTFLLWEEITGFSVIIKKLFHMCLNNLIKDSLMRNWMIKCYNSQHEHSMPSNETSLNTYAYTYTQQKATKKTILVKVPHNTFKMVVKKKDVSRQE